MAHKLYIKYTYICIMHRTSTSNIYRVCETSDCLDSVATVKISVATKNNSWLIWRVKKDSGMIWKISSLQKSVRSNVQQLEQLPILLYLSRLLFAVVQGIISLFSHRCCRIQYCPIENCIATTGTVLIQFKQTVSLVCIIDVYKVTSSLNLPMSCNG